MNLNTKTWKEFSFSDIFIIKKGFYNKKPEHTKDGNIPFLGATEKNNGITDYFSLEDIENASKTGDENNAPISEKIFPANALCVTNNGSVGFAYYQDKEFTCSHDVNPLYIKNGTFNRYTGLFVASVISKDRYRWAYGRKWRPERMINSKIMLPSNEDGTPNWQFMEDYIKSLHSRILTTKNKQYQNPYSLDIEKWKEFQVKDIFNIYNGKGITQQEIEDNPGDFIVVQSGAENNGVLGHIDLNYCKSMGYVYDTDMCLTVARSGSAGFVSFQKKGCVVGDSAKILKLKFNSSIYIYLFIKTILMANKYKYTYGRKVTEDKYLDLIIKLPVKYKDKQSEDDKEEIIYDNTHKYSPKGYIPDWDFMENYIKSLPYGDKL